LLVRHLLLYNGKRGKGNGKHIYHCHNHERKFPVDIPAESQNSKKEQTHKHQNRRQPFKQEPVSSAEQAEQAVARIKEELFMIQQGFDGTACPAVALACKDMDV